MTRPGLTHQCVQESSFEENRIGSLLQKETSSETQSNSARCCEMNDRFSELPADILLSILSSFTMKELLRTRIVSREWKHLWKYVTVLQFEDQEACNRMLRSKKVIEGTSKFVSLVNHVLNGHRALDIEKLKIKFSLDTICEYHISKWVNFAISKRVKILEIDLQWFTQHRDAYSSLHIDVVNIKLPLTSFILKYVNVTGDQIENLLLRCPSLENLSISESNSLTSLRVCGSSSISLKYLEILSCPEFTSLEISTPKLLTFIYEGSSTIMLRIVHAPLLSKVSIGGIVKEPMGYVFESLWNYFSQLVEFDLTITLDDDAESNLTINHVVPALPNLKYLRLFIYMRSYQSFLGWAALIEASPVLEKLSLDMWCAQYDSRKTKSKYEGCPLMSLKTLELRSVPGFDIDLELVNYVVKNAIVLENVIIHPGEMHLRYPIPKNQIDEVEKMLPTGVKLTIISNWRF